MHSTRGWAVPRPHLPFLRVGAGTQGLTDAQQMPPSRQARSSVLSPCKPAQGVEALVPFLSYCPFSSVSSFPPPRSHTSSLEDSDSSYLALCCRIPEFFSLQISSAAEPEPPLSTHLAAWSRERPLAQAALRSRPRSLCSLAERKAAGASQQPAAEMLL